MSIDNQLRHNETQKRLFESTMKKAKQKSLSKFYKNLEKDQRFYDNVQVRQYLFIEDDDKQKKDANNKNINIDQNSIHLSTKVKFNLYWYINKNDYWKPESREGGIFFLIKI